MLTLCEPIARNQRVLGLLKRTEDTLLIRPQSLFQLRLSRGDLRLDAPAFEDRNRDRRPNGKEVPDAKSKSRKVHTLTARLRREGESRIEVRTRRTGARERCRDLGLRTAKIRTSAK